MKTLLRQRTFWAALSAILTAIGAVIAAPPAMRLTVAIGSLAACFAAMGTIFAREGGENAALALSGYTPMTAETINQVVAAQEAKGVGMAGEVGAVVAAAAEEKRLP